MDLNRCYSAKTFFICQAVHDCAFVKIKKIKNYFTIRMSDLSDPDQDRRSFSPDLGPNSLQSHGSPGKVVSVYKQYYVIQKGDVFSFMHVFFSFFFFLNWIFFCTLSFKPYLWHWSCEGSGETVHMQRLVYRLA